MKPYYEHGGITIYCGDCREVLPTLEPVDLLLTDPPYPGLKGGLSWMKRRDTVAPPRARNQTLGEPWGSDISALGIARFTMGAFVFCSHHCVAEVATLIEGERAALITWYHPNSRPPLRNAPHQVGEFVWAFRRDPGLNWKALRTVYEFPFLTAGCISTGERFTNPDGTAFHPAQKPLALFGALLAVAPKSVLDPYAGTGTTLVAAKQRGVRAIGVEIEERYCELAAHRLAQEVLPLEVAA